MTKKYKEYQKTLKFIQDNPRGNAGFKATVENEIMKAYNKKEITPLEYQMLTDSGYKKEMKV